MIRPQPLLRECEDSRALSFSNVKNRIIDMDVKKVLNADRNKLEIKIYCFWISLRLRVSERVSFFYSFFSSEYHENGSFLTEEATST